MSGNELVSVATGQVVVHEDEDAAQGMLQTSEDDFQTARAAALEVLTTLSKNFGELEDIAFSSQDHRAYDALGRFAQVVQNAAANLIAVNEKRFDIRKKAAGVGQKQEAPVINNNFLVTTADLLRQVVNERQSMKIIDATPKQ